MASKNSELWRQARRARDTLVEQLVDHPEVSMVDIGYDPEPEAGQDPDRVVVRVHVRRSPAEMGLDLPQQVDGIQVRVVHGDYQPQQEAAPPDAAPPDAAQSPPSQAQMPSRGRRRKHTAATARKGAAEQETQAQQPDLDWQGLADFAISLGLVPGTEDEPRLETRARHVQTGESMHWQGMALEQLAAWIGSQANLPSTANSPEMPTGQAASVASDHAETALVELSGLWVSQAKAPSRPGQSGGPNVLRAEVCFSVVEPAPAVMSAGQVPYTVEFLFLNCETDEWSSAALYEGLLRPGEMDCPIEQDLPIPPLGRYQLHLIARLSPPGDGIDRLVGPTIIVEK